MHARLEEWLGAVLDVAPPDDDSTEDDVSTEEDASSAEEEGVEETSPAE